MRMMENLIQSFNERMKNIGLFAPLLRLEKPQKFAHLPIPSIALLILLYVLENKLMENRNTSPEEMEHFLYELVRTYWDDNFDSEQVSELQEWLVGKHLRNKGMAHIFHYYDFQAEELKEHHFYLLEYDEYSLEKFSKQQIEFKLSPDGIELLFKTKEMFAELKITISQLYFKQQMEKGLFDGALRSVDEMAMTIENEKQRMKLLQTQIIQDALAISKKKDLQDMLERYHTILEEEKRRFDELKELVKERVNSFYNDELTEKEVKGINLVLEIADKLENVAFLHESLFTEKQKTQHLMTDSIESSIIHAFSTNLNFEQEILRPISEVPISLDGLRRMLAPMLPIHTPKMLAPGIVFEAQKRAVKREEIEEVLPTLTEEEKLEAERREREWTRRKEDKQKKYLKLLLIPLKDRNKIVLSKLLQDLEEQDPNWYNRLSKDMEFYSFLVLLHQSEYTKLERLPEKNIAFVPSLSRHLHELVVQYPELEQIGHFSIRPLDDTIVLKSGFRISNVEIVRGNLYVGAEGAAHE